MRIRIVLGAAVVTAILALATSADAQDLTSRQMTALKGAAADKQVRSDLLSILEPVQEISSGNRLRLGDIGLWTRPYPAEFEGLCRRDVLDLKYAPTESPQAHQRDTKVRPVGVEASPFYHAVRLPKAITSEAGVSWLWDDACDSVPDNLAVWFSARDAQQAAQAVHWLQATIDLARAGKLRVSGCEKFPVTKLSCDELVQHAHITSIAGVQDCPNESNDTCLVVDIGDETNVTIKGRAAPDSLDPASVVSISVEQYVIVT